MRHRPWLVYSFIAGMLLLSGCVGGSSSPDYFYRLNIPDPEARLDPAPLHGTLQVTRPWTDALTSERHLVYRKDGNTPQLNHHAYHRWADSPTLLLQQEMTQYLRKAGIALQVVTPEMRTKADYTLSCRIAKLERVLDHSPRVILELELGITSIKNRRTLLLRTYSEEQPAKDLEVTSSIHAYNQALSNILHRFLTDTSKLPFLQLTDSRL